MKNAFTMIELVFVIVVLGILAAVAVPRLAATRDDATVAKFRSEVASIRSGIINDRNAKMMRGENAWPDLQSRNGALFANVLQTPIYPRKGESGWKAGADATSFEACIKKNQCTTFVYNKTGTPATPASGTTAAVPAIPAGTFDCDHNDDACKIIAE